MKVDSQKPKEWVKRTNEPNCRFAKCACAKLFKAHVHLPCLLYFALVPTYFILFFPYLLCFAHVLPMSHCDFILLDLEGFNYKN